MASPVQLTVDLNNIARSVTEIFKDAREFKDDHSQLTKTFRRELARTESFEQIIRRKKFTGETVLIDEVGELQKQSFLDSLAQVHSLWTKFCAVSIASQSSGRDTQNTATQSTTVRERLKARSSWVFGGKSKAEKILARVRVINDNLREDVELAVKYFIDDAPNTSAVIASDTVAGVVGVAADISRLRVERNLLPLNRSLLLPAETVKVDHISGQQPASRLRCGTFRGIPALIELRPIVEITTDSIDRALRLAMFLNQGQTDGFYVPKCQGVCHNKRENRFEYIFYDSSLSLGIAHNDDDAAQSTVSPTNLRNMWQELESDGAFKFSRLSSKLGANNKVPLSISQRLAIARCLASTVYRLHLVDWLHQNINSQNIWFTKEINKSGSGGYSSTRIGTPHLFGFQYARMVDQYSDDTVRTTLPKEENIYRHPDRQIITGTKPRSPHNKTHDIYSLGVILLEIGLGRLAIESFKLIELLPGGVAGMQSNMQLAKGLFIQLSEKFLPERMGTKYAAITQACLEGTLQDYLEESPRDGEMSPETLFRIVVLEGLDKLSNLM